MWNHGALRCILNLLKGNLILPVSAFYNVKVSSSIDAKSEYKVIYDQIEMTMFVLISDISCGKAPGMGFKLTLGHTTRYVC